MQHHDRAGGSRLQVGQHGFEVDLAALRIVVAVATHLEACPGEQSQMVLPGRCADQHLGSGGDPLEEVGAHLQAAGATQRLHGDYPLARQQR